MNILSVLQSAVAQGAIWAVMALGIYISYRVLEFADLSVDGSFALGGAVSMVMTVNGVNAFASLPVSLLAGMCAGLVTAFMATKLKIPGLLSGILTMLALYSINLMIMGTSNIQIKDNLSVIKLVQTVLPLPRDTVAIIIGAVFSVALVLALYWFFGTELGCAIRATGNNPHMARALGANTDVMTMCGLALSNGLVALSGALWVQYQGWADVGMGTGTMVTGLASIIIGQTLFRFLRRSFALKLLTAALGSVSYWIIVTIVVQLGLGANNMKLITAAMVVVFLAVPMLRQRFFPKKVLKSEAAQTAAAFESAAEEEGK